MTVVGKHLITLAAAGGMAVGAALPVPRALADPILYMSLYDAAGVSSCAAGTLNAAKTTCTLAPTTGTGSNIFTTTPDTAFSNFDVSTAEGIAFPATGFAEPRLWLEYNVTSLSPGASMEIVLTATDMTTPLGSFELESLISGTADPGISQTATSYFDAGNGQGVPTYFDSTGDTGITGTALTSYTLTSASGNGGAFNLVDNGGEFSETWDMVVSAGDTDAPLTIGGQDEFEAPEPATLSLFASGLLAFGLMFHRKRRKSS